MTISVQNGLVSNNNQVIQHILDIGLGVRVFANGPGDLGSIPGRVIPKTQKMVLDASLLNTQHYKVRIKGKVEQSREGVAPSLHLGVVAIEKEAFGLPSTMVANFTFYLIQHNPQILSRASPSDGIECYTQDTPLFLRWGTVSVF